MFLSLFHIICLSFLKVSLIIADLLKTQPDQKEDRLAFIFFEVLSFNFLLYVD